MASAAPLPERERVLEERKKYIGYNVALNFAKDPIMVVRGSKQYLYDEAGNEYLDCVNNVAHVGHEHPRVVEAGVTQMRTLNTNSRYLHPGLAEYAKKLTATLPKPLEVVFFVNSGSEANDLALRLARCHTGKRGVLCMAGGYSGHTVTLIDISPYKFESAGGQPQRAWVKQAPVPDVHSGMYRGSVDDESLGAAYAAEAGKQVDAFDAMARREAKRKAARAARKAARASAKAAAVASSGVNVASSNAAAASTPCSSASSVSAPALLDEAPEPVSDGEEDSDYDDDGLTAGCGAFLAESILSCGGQVVPPKGYLRRVYERVRSSGGVCIADEVQVGFGRVGSAFWAFQLQGEDVVPDIVTMGKPVGNGYPVALVVTTPAIAASFNNGMGYFNTFGGNQVASAVALATLDVIQEEGLQANAARVGAVLLEGFHRLAEKHAVIGSVRGVGLMVGLECVKDRATREPHPEAASAIAYAMRRRRILLSCDGHPTYNVIKLKPPMCFTEENARRVVAELGEVLAELGY